MRLLVDTNRYAAVIGVDGSSFPHWQDATEVWLSLITIGELLTGFALGSRQQENERRLSQLIETQGVGILPISESTSRRYAEIQSFLRRQGTQIPSNDAWIAAQALEHDLMLDTLDHHFRRIPGLSLLEQS
ncbi:MAG: type II toxin-antitoxin system VapC family toxin [Pirellulales bacterium]|nr:type II toxin-antitoxin system VapC family toxin [Pirellulales bacterium]